MNSTDNKRPDNSDELFESLFANAATRRKAPGDEEDRIRGQLHTQWQEMTGARRRRRRVTGVAIAASFVLVALVSTGIFNRPGAPMTPETLASVDKIDGRVMVDLSDGRAQDVQSNTALESGSVLTTAYDARLAFSWTAGESIRLDENSRLRLISASEIELLNGRVYVDSHADRLLSSAGNALTIDTAFGRVRHIGTQYMTSLTHDQVAVSVRQGSVLVLREDIESIAKPGQQLRISSGGDVSLTSIQSYGENWQWVEAISPGFALDGRSLADFLAWVASESGHSLSYASAVVESLAIDTVMHGSVNLEPMRALEMMLQTSDLVARVENGKILVDLQ